MIFIFLSCRDKTVAALSRCFAAPFLSAQRGGVTRDTLAGSYPRLAALIESTCTRIAKDGTARDSPSALTHAQASALLAVAADAESAYVAAVQHRLELAAGTAFPGGNRSVPTAADLQTLVANVHEELKAAVGGGERLATLIAVVVGGALAAAARRAELMAAGGPEAKAVGGACTPAQARNMSLCNALHELHRSVAALVPRLPDPAAAALLPALEALQATSVDLVAPLFRAMVDAVQDRIQKVHSLNLGADDGSEGEVVDTSACMREVVRQIAAFRTEYLCKFSPPPSMAGPSSVPRALLERMASRLLVFFVRHAALVRPLSRPGKLQLAKDAAELEAAIEQHLVPPEQLGPPVRALRSFRRLLFLESKDVPGNAAVRDVPASAVLHHLFSRVPEAVLESPHARNKLTPAQYSLWLDQHTEAEALQFIKKALDAGATKAVAQQSGAEHVRVMQDVLRSFGAT